MYSFKEKKTHSAALRNPDAARYDLELLAKEAPMLPQLATFSRNPKRYHDDILYALLDYVTRERIREYRRTMMAKDDGGKPGKAPADTPTEELKQALEEAETRAEEAEQRADEAEEARDEAEARAEEIEQALEEEKKKEPA